MCVNVDYLLTLYDFFIEGLPKGSETIQINGKEALVLAEEEIAPSINQRIFCDVKIENPQFILYENQFELQKSNSLIIDVNI